MKSSVVGEVGPEHTITKECGCGINKQSERIFESKQLAVCFKTN
jgi:hypothetical protein